MPALRYLVPCACILLVGGCRQYGYLVKRESELNCPTDIRQTVPWCVGEDAIFRCPCGPDGDFYGHKPTCWGVWPAPGAHWRDAFCGPLQHECVLVESSEPDVGRPILPDPLPTPAAEPGIRQRPGESEPSKQEPDEIELDNPAAGEVERLPGPDISPSQKTEPEQNKIGSYLLPTTRSQFDALVKSPNPVATPRDERRRSPTSVPYCQRRNFSDVDDAATDRRRVSAPRLSMDLSALVDEPQQMNEGPRSETPRVSKKTRESASGEQQDVIRRKLVSHVAEDHIRKTRLAERQSNRPGDWYAVPHQRWSPTFVR